MNIHNVDWNYRYKNRDKGKCKICGGYVEPNEAHFHHVEPKLPSSQRNKVKNLITVHEYCHTLIHNDSEPEDLSEKTMKKTCEIPQEIK